ncbi:2OG-Fe dioxygenase-domain-containing protein [Phlyctochytrium arcticum]|nr:2OG-Fe dioxygenase-domain-containing protein [Phlyctochytrium arcticum]
MSPIPVKSANQGLTEETQINTLLRDCPAQENDTYTLPKTVEENLLSHITHLRTTSHIRFNPRQNLGLSEDQVEQDLQQLRWEFANLSTDIWVPSDWSRFRGYSRAVVLPWESPLRVRYLPPYLDSNGNEQVPYNQGPFNQDCNNVRRWYDPITAETRQLALLNRMILADVALCDWSEDELRHPILVGIHFVKTAPNPDWPVGINTPNALHQDGHKFSFVHMVQRVNAAGGDNIVAAVQHGNKHPDDIPQEDILANFLLEEPLDSFAVYDERCTHFAGAVRQAQPGHDKPSERSVFILDVEPMVAAVCPI